MIAIAITIFWVVCGVLSYGLTFGHFQHKFATIAEQNYNQDLVHALIGGLMGPIGLLSIWLLGGGRYGFKWK